MELDKYREIHALVSRGEQNFVSINEMKEILQILDDTRVFLRELRGHVYPPGNPTPLIKYWQRNAGDLIRRIG